MSKETYGIILGVGSFIVFLALYLIDRSGKNLPVYVSVGLLFLLAALSLSGALLVPWFWPSSLAERVWRVFLIGTVVLLLVGRFGIWLGFLSGKPEIVAPAVQLAPAGFISFLGQVLNGYAPMMQENQTDTPLDDVSLTIIQDFPLPDDPSRGTVGWQKQINIGTVRAKLTIGLEERFPVGGQDRIRFQIIMLTRLQTYRETIELTKQNIKEYKAEMKFYGGGIDPPYTRTETLGVVTFPPLKEVVPVEPKK